MRDRLIHLVVVGCIALEPNLVSGAVKLDSMGRFLTSKGYGGAQLVDSGKFYHLPLRSNQSSGHLVVDTGSSSTIIFRSSVKRLGLSETRTRFRVRGAFGQGSDNYGLALIQSFQAGNCLIRNVPVGIAPDLGGMKGYAWPNGLLGTRELMKFGAILDLAHRMIYLRPSRPDPEVTSTIGSMLERSGWKPVHLTLIHDHLRVPAEVNDKPCHLLVDTGAYLTALDRGFARAFEIPIRPTHATAHGVGRTGGTVALGTFRSLWIGDYQIRNGSLSIVSMDPQMLGRGTNAEVVGLLGVEYLARNSAIFDFVSGTLYLRLPQRP